ncbi:MAG: cytochrome c oxidase cbb3-type subunit 3, partial [Saprospiraceae bacterium]
MKKIRLKINFLALLFAVPLFTFAAQDGKAANPDFYSDLSGYLIGVIGAVVIAGTLALLVNLLNQIIKLREIEVYREQGWEEFLEVKKVNEVPWWQRFSRIMTDRVPLEKEEAILFDHEYDGIRELDNNLPPWWVYGFYLTIGISIFYMGYYHFSSHAKSSAELYAIEMQEAKEATDRHLAKQADKIDESNVVALTDVAALSDGKSVFDALCVACHLQSGGGSPVSVGPNLTDQYWLHGGGIKDVFKTIKYGVPEKGMISWKTQLRPAEILSVASYILSLQGTNP